MPEYLHKGWDIHMLMNTFHIPESFTQAVWTIGSGANGAAKADETINIDAVVKTKVFFITILILEDDKYKNNINDIRSIIPPPFIIFYITLQLQQWILHIIIPLLIRHNTEK